MGALGVYSLIMRTLSDINVPWARASDFDPTMTFWHTVPVVQEFSLRRAGERTESPTGEK